jgi:limonene-1,2-epoxide hydrolase
MSTTEIVDAFIAAIEAKDVDLAVSMTAADISYENMPAAPIVGHAGLAKTLQGFLAPASAVDWQIVRQWAFDRVVVNERHDRFQIGDGWLELPIAGIFEIGDNDKISLWRDYFDMGSYTRQFAKLTST